MNPTKYISHIIPSLTGRARTKEILKAGPNVPEEREQPQRIVVSVYNYTPEALEEYIFSSVYDALACKDNNKLSWINIDGIRNEDVEVISEYFGIHPLLVEDILSLNQRPKMDEVEGVLYCLLNMLYFNEEHGSVETEQVSIVLGKDFVITFQEDPMRDVFNPVRDRLRLPNSKLRLREADYLCYSLLDIIVDNYFLVMEALGDRIEKLEEMVIRNSGSLTMAEINRVRKELIVLKRNIAPVRDLVGNIIRSESPLLQEGTTKYFKDIYDHIIQAFDLSETYRDVMMSMQDLYINNVNLKLNEVMKVMAIVTCLLAPATVIGGIFGMNFDFIPASHHQWGFYVAVAVMLFIPVLMLFVFKRRGWF